MAKKSITIEIGTPLQSGRRNRPIYIPTTIQVDDEATVTIVPASVFHELGIVPTCTKHAVFSDSDYTADLYVARVSVRGKPAENLRVIFGQEVRSIIWGADRAYEYKEPLELVTYTLGGRRTDEKYTCVPIITPTHGIIYRKPHDLTGGALSDCMS